MLDNLQLSAAISLVAKRAGLPDPKLFELSEMIRKLRRESGVSYTPALTDIEKIKTGSPVWGERSSNDLYYLLVAAFSPRSKA